MERKTASSIYSSYVGADNYEIGVLAGNYVRNLLNGHGKIIEVMGLPNSTPTIERHKGFIDGIRQSPNITITAMIGGSWMRDSAKE